ncbi:polycystic kidney disease protein 1-like 2 [Dendronephthya gigantea]|uniref:polycystic kidney disease protein 1-like 2 n=1 Tax=Dendronephthya gigantea TaxID=151771 RepID=UPI00106C4818|nr:polycystic kidney disease protein 1-like 2 [Dendronephthya gigantea]
MAVNPIDELDMGIKPYSLHPGKKYILSFRATRASGVFGEMRHTMLVNTPPKNGNCSIFPFSGLAAQTNFTISCENWIDKDAPLSYEFFYETGGIKVVLFYRTISPGRSISETDWLGIGDERDEYRLNVTVVVKDFFGSKSRHIMTVQVLPPPVTSLDMDRILGLVSGENSLLQHYFGSKRSPKALSLCSTVGLILNHIAQKNTTNNSSEISSAQVKETVLKSISSANMSIKDTSAMKQVSSTIFTLTKEPDELTPDSQDTALDICRSLTGNLKELSNKDNGFEEIVTSLGFVLGSLGQINNGSTKETELSPNQVKRTTGIVGNLQNIVVDNLVTSEGPLSVETETFSIQAELVQVKDFGQKKNILKNCDFHPPSANALGMKEIIDNPNNTFLQMQPIHIKLAVFNKNPFNWDNTSETITSDVVDIVIDSKMNISSSNFSEEAGITVARNASQFPKPNGFYMKPSQTNSTASTKEYLKYHCFNRSSNYTSMNFEIHPDEIGIHLKVYLKSGGKPDIKSGDFDLSYHLPDLKSCSVPEGTIMNSEILHNHNFGQAILVDLKNCSRDPYTVFVSNQDLNDTGKHCFAVQHIQYLNESSDEELDAGSASRKRRSVSCEVGARRVRRSCVIVPPAPPKPTHKPPIKILVADNLGFDGKFFFPNQTPNYNSTMFESSCMHWDVENETWTGDGCRVAPGTNKETIVCYCDHLTSFGSDLLVAPNPIDFDSVFQNFGSLAENVAVLALISTILGLYIIGVIWARRADKKDLLMLGPTILSNPKGNYHYLISTFTGSRQSAGTTARVVFKMTGDEGETQPVRLKDRHRPCFQRGQENAFIVSYPKGVGDLTYLQIWHDNSGSSPAWYLSRILVKDLQTGETWPLFCENWLAVESEDGKVCRLLSVANEQEMVSFGHLFSKRAITGLADGHIWFSIVSRPPTSNFTRVQRLSCALCLLCCTMITSAMFYNMGGQGPSPFAVNIGSLVIDLKPFVIGLQSSVIIIPVNVLLVQIFRNLRPKDEGHGKEHKNDKPNDGEENSNTSKGKLPHWFIFIAYAICYLASGASIFFTLLYSIQWGKETSTEWVIAMVTSFLQSALLLQPVKVVLMAVIFALFIRKPDNTENESNNVELRDIPAKDKTGEEIPTSVKKKAKYYSPPDAETLKVARLKRLKEIKTNAAVWEIMAFFFFLILLMDVANYHRDTNSFLMTKTLYETFDEVDAFSIDLSAVSDTDSLWMWARETLIPGLYANEWYNGRKIKEGWIANMEDYLVGVPRVRLLRVEKDSCPISSYFEGKISHCYDGYSVSIEEDGTYNVGWESLDSDTPRKRRDVSEDVSEDVSIPWTEIEWTAIVSNGSNSSSDESKTRSKRALDPIMGGSSGRKRRKKKRLLSSTNPKVYTINDNAILPSGKILSCLERWRHRTMLELRGFPNWGAISWYSGGGYATNLGYDQVTAYTVISDLHSNGWVDVQSRAVLVEFTVYNANTNLFGIITIFVEFLPSSGAITKTDFQASRFYLQLSGGQTLAHVLVIFFMLYFLFRESKLVYKQRLAYFKGFWNWIETILVISQFLLIILFLARLYEVDRNLLQLRENPKDYVGFQYAGQADAFMTFVLGVLVFFYTIRFLRILRFNKNFLVIGRTLSRISSPILSFCVPFIFGFFAFAMFAFTIFSSELEDYSSFIRTIVTQLAMTLGDFDFEALFMVNPMLATLYFFSFIGLNVMVLMNMFIAIINDSYAEIQEETAEIENEIEIVDYVVDRLTNGVYSKIKRGKVAPLKDKSRKNTKKKIKKPPKRLFLDDNSVDLDSRVTRLDNILKSMDSSLRDEEVIGEQFLAVPCENQDVFFRVLCLIEENNTYYDSDDDDDSDEDMDDWSDFSDDSLH